MSKYNHLEVETKLQKKWEREKTYAYDPAHSKEKFVIDTPPPTVSGSLHIGHIFSYTQTDLLARLHRMLGKNVFYPMGWDDNGLPTEKRIQNLYGVKCDPKMDYNPSFKFEILNKKTRIYKNISRKNFLELCAKQVLEDEVKYKNLWNHIALSVDWNQSYQTISPYVQKLSQISFLDLYQKNLVENQFSPVLWDTQFQTAVAQADIEDREIQGFYHDITFTVENNADNFTISTTRPELLPACVAVAAHPTDDRYKRFFGSYALTPLFHKRVPIIASTHADPKKGTGILMICTFGDMEDVVFCKKHKLSTLQVLNDEGCFKDIPFDKEPFKSNQATEAMSNYSQIKGLRVKQARTKLVEMLKEKKVLKGEPKSCLHHVKFYEKGDFPLEILPKRQWYIKLLDHKKELLDQAKKINWHPSSMRKRYEQWVEGLNQNWCISRQRVYGVPFPLWYPIDDKGQINYKNPILPEKNLKESIDPLKQTPKGFIEEQRNQAKGFIAESDVMDTWASSSLTPFINSGWPSDTKKHKELFPADLRSQAHEIIRTWAFYTIAKSYFHEKQIPWKNIAISGWVVTPDKMKMSKSKGNALNPENLINSYSADGVRYWAAKARLGQDTVYDENLFKTGKRLVTKIFNASRFVKMQLDELSFKPLEASLQEVTIPLDKVWLHKLLSMQLQARKHFENFNHTEALEEIEKTFWSFCDNYLELIKARVYQLKDQSEGLSGKRSLDYSLYIFLKYFAPFLPYVTEEIWGERFLKESSSIHTSYWPDNNTIQQMQSSLCENRNILEPAFLILEQIRSQKSNQKKSLATPLQKLEITANDKQLKDFDLYIEDIARASHVDLKNISTILDKSLENPSTKIVIQE